MTHETTFFADQKLPLELVEADKLSRKIRACGGSLMMVEVFFEAGAIGYEHEHPHEQMCYCLAGEFVFTVGTESRTIGAGDSLYIAANVRHGAACLNAGRLLDIFTPQREDFLPK